MAYVGLIILGVGSFWALQQFGYVDAVTARFRSVSCGVAQLSCPARDDPAGTGRMPAGTPDVPIQPSTRGRPAADDHGGWSGVGRRSTSTSHLPWPLIIGGAALFGVFWWDVPRRLRRRFGPAPKSPREQRRAKEARQARLAEPGPAEAKKNAPVAIAGIDPGIAAKGMRVGVRSCEITLRPGADGTVVLDKTLARTSDREFTLVSRAVRRSLRDPEFVATLIEETGRAVAYLDGNPQLAGADARRSELRSLVGALEGDGSGQPR